MTAGYSKRPLVEKLGIKPNSTVAILNAPTDFERMLGPLPGGVVLSPALDPVDSTGRPRGVRIIRSGTYLRSKPDKQLDFIHAFFLDSKNLDRQFPSLKKALSQTGALWISWPKRAAKMETDLSDNVVREIGLRHGLVDIKVCAVDEVWSGLKFVYRLRDRH